VTAATLLRYFHIVQRFSFCRLGSCRSEVFHVIGLTFCPPVLLDLLKVQWVPVRKPGVVAGPAPNRDQHVLFLFIIVSLYSFSVH